MTIKVIDKNSFKDYKKILEAGIKDFIPMLPYVKSEFNDFSRYLQFGEKAICLVDEVSKSETCIYHLYTLPDDDGLLRSRLLLPSSFENRFDIVDRSIQNFKKWLDTQPFKKFMIQMLEHGEIEYYPTLSTYLLPTLIKQGFNPYYRVYMRKDEDSQGQSPSFTLPSDISFVHYSPNLKDQIISFFYHQDPNGYFINCSYKEFLDYIETDDFKKSAMFLQNSSDQIVAGVFSGYEEYDNKVWVDNFKIGSCDQTGHEERILGQFLLGKQLELINKSYPQKEVIVYLSREFQKPIHLFEEFNYYCFEFWVDAILEK